MNSYQTANAAFHLAGASRDAGVKHGRNFFFQHALGYFGYYGSSVIGTLARDLQLDYTETKLSNGRAAVPTLHGRRKGGIAAAKAGGTSWGVLPKYVVVTGFVEEELVFYVARTRDMQRATFYTTSRSLAESWAKMRNEGTVGDFLQDGPKIIREAP